MVMTKINDVDIILVNEIAIEKWRYRMVTLREEIVDLIFSLPDDQLEQLREWINENKDLQDASKTVMNKVIDNAHGNIRIEKMEETLWKIKDSYVGFVKAVLNYVDKNYARYEKVTEFLMKHPEALSSEILEFISDQDDFYDDAALAKEIEGLETEEESYEKVLEQYVKVGNLKELHERLRNVPDSYTAFVGGIIRYASTARERKEKVLAFMNEHPDARTSDITKFVMDQDDFHEAARSTRKNN